MTRVTGSLRLPVTSALATIAATICLGSTFLRATWFIPSVVAVLLVTLGCELSRRFASTRAVVPLGGAVALAAYLLLRYAGDSAWYHLVPTAASLDRLDTLAAAGREDIARYAAPIGVSPGIEFLAVAGIGLVALAVDTLAVTARRAALAGLPLLVMYTVPLTVAPDGVSWLAFAIGAVGYLALLLAESRERVSRWGRPMAKISPRPNWRPEPETAPLGQVGRRVGATALGLALVVPAVIPDLNASTFGFGNGGFGNGSGGGNKVSVVNPILDLGKDLRRPQDRPVISYSGPAARLRLVGLDEFTGPQWKPSELEVSRDNNNVEDGLARPPGLGRDVKTTKTRYEVQVFDLKQTWLPLPYPTTKVSAIDGTWLYDRDSFNVFGENTSTLQLTYGVRALDVAWDPVALRNAPPAPGSFKPYLNVPKDIDPEIEAQARAQTRGLDSGYDRALALQDWLRSEEFTYSVDVQDTVGDGNGSAAILSFLENRTGYCVQFSSTMAVMARLLGIPARVAVGFLPGTPDGAGRRTVTLHDAHAWPELYFEGAGWVPFEPTPAIRTGEPPSWAQAATAGGPDGGATDPGTDANSGGAGALNPRVEERRRSDIPGLLLDTPAGPAAIGAGPVQVPVIPLLIGLGILLLLATPGVVRLVVRRRRWSGAHGAAEKARAAWADLQDTATDFGYSWLAPDTPRAGIDRLVRDRALTAEPAQAAHRLAMATERARYAPEMAEVGDLRADVDAVRSGLAGSSSGFTRWRARLLPRSTRSVSTAIGERFADGLDAFDRATARITTGLTRRPRRS